MYARHGAAYELAFPGFGSGPRGEVVVTTDPEAMLRVMRSEGNHPTGAVEKIWPAIEALRIGTSISPSTIDGFYSRDPEWKRLRAGFQTELMSPQTARGFMPGINKAAEMASKGAARAGESGTVGAYLNYCSFDMYSTVQNGHFTNVAANDHAAPCDPADREFCDAAIRVLDGTAVAMANPVCLVANALGVPGWAPMVKSMGADFGITMGRALAIAEGVLERRARGEALTSYEQNSCLVQGITRLEEAADDDDTVRVTKQEFLDLQQITLTASVDTTSTYIAWVLAHLALNPEAQQKLRDEIAAKLPDGNITEAVAASPKREMPYLVAVLRESHRLTPSMIMSVNKHVADEEGLEIAGFHVPKGTLVSLASYPVQVDHAMVGPDVEEFRPERWFKDAVEARKGTPAEILDHRLFAGPFSAGARMCPGSRVAGLEAKAMICRLVHDWQFRFSSNSGVATLDDVGGIQGTVHKPTNLSLEFEPL